MAKYFNMMTNLSTVQLDIMTNLKNAVLLLDNTSFSISLAARDAVERAVITC